MVRDLLIHTLRSPEAASRLSMSEWDTLVRQARSAGLQARLLYRLRQHGLTDAIPASARWHFEAAETLARKQRTAIHWELHQIRDALADLEGPVLILKGAAYVAAHLPVAEGRMFNDIDILVPRTQLADAEASLMLAGWHATPLSDYDRHYYRRWMHEIPPMRHAQRETVIDVHHAILPDTARYRPDSAKLLERAVAVPDLPGLMVPSPEDRILHSAAHLFHDGELPHGLRDLTDLDLLLRDVAPDAWPQLLARARELDLTRPLFYALRYTGHFLDTPIPDNLHNAMRDTAPSRPAQMLMDAVFMRALMPDHASCADACTSAARLAAYVRAHWLRMPLHLLLPHLFHKAFLSPLQETRQPRTA